MADINLSPYTADQQAMDRRRKMAEAMQQQAIAPIEMPTMPGVRVSPYAGLAKMLQSYVAARNLNKSDEEYKAHENAISEDAAKFFRNMGKTETVPGDIITPGKESMFIPENVTKYGEIKDHPERFTEEERNAAIDLPLKTEAVAPEYGPSRQVPLLNAGLLEPTNPLAFKTPQIRNMLAQYLMQQEAQKQAAAQAELAASRQIHTLNPEQTAGRFVNGQFVPLVTGKPKELTDYQNYQLQLQNNANAIAAVNAQDKTGLTVSPEVFQINPKIKGVPTFAKKTNRIDVKTKKPIYTFNGEDYIED
jgi:hypothetical protein